MATIPLPEEPKFGLEMEEIQIHTPVHANEMNQRYERLLENDAYMEKKKASKSTVLPVTLPASGWTGSAPPYQNTISLEGATQDNLIEMLPAPELTIAQAEAYMAAAILNGRQAVGSVTLCAWGEKPLVDLPAIAVVRGDV